MVLSLVQTHNELSLLKKLKSVPSMDGLDLAKQVTCRDKHLYNTSEKTNYNVAVIDLGIKSNILRLFSGLGCKLSVFPASVSKKEILECYPRRVTFI